MRAILARPRRGAALVLVQAALVAACTSALPPREGAGCAGAGLRIDADFERGGLAGCTVLGPVRAELRFQGESRPINDSAWYAFRVSAEDPRSVRLQLVFDGGTFRYAPHTSHDARHWSAVPAGQLQVSADRTSAELRLPLDRRPVFVAAQPLQGGEAAVAALRPTLRRAGFQESLLARSRDGRKIPAFELRPAGTREAIVLLARQHPPETTGALAFDAFVTELATAPEAADLRRDTAILVLPLLNPDGLARGHWRGNAAGVDLNRDWVQRAEPEIRAAAERIEALAATQRLRLLIDFHSTRRDVLYAPPPGLARDDAGERFVTALRQRLGAAAPPVQREHVAGRGTAKGWALDAFGIAGLTYEVGDETAPITTTQQARIAAHTLAGVLRAPDDGQWPMPGEAAFRHTRWPGPPVPVWYHRPRAAGPASPVIFVMHGVQRDADRYLREWIGLAETFGFVVVVPEFSAAAFPSADAYNLGNTLDAQDRLQPRETWTYSVLEGIFDEVRKREGLRATGYSLYGHSAGAQFVHRFVLFAAGKRLQRAVAANAGWYTFPTAAQPWPYGLGGPIEAGVDLPAALGAPLTILVGDADTDPAHPSLRRTPEALSQGEHRYARALSFFAAGQAAAAAAGLPFAWSCAIAPGLGHDNGRAAGFAIGLLLGDPPPAGAACRSLPAH
jgi:predicted deacylase